MEDPEGTDGQASRKTLLASIGTYAALGAAVLGAVAIPAVHAADHPSQNQPAYQELLPHEIPEDRLEIDGYEVRLPTKMDVLPKEGGAYQRDADLEPYVLQGQYAHSWQRLPTDHSLRDGGLGKYHCPEEVAEELQALAKKAPGIAHVEVIEKSELGNPIYALRIGRYAQMDEDERPDRTGVLLVGQFHAREAISVEIPLATAQTLVEGYGKDPYLTELVDTRDTWVIPSINPDGGMITAEQVRRYGDSDWRKNARDHSELVEDEGSREARSSSLHGVDLNRNFPVAFGERGASGAYWHQTYHGEKALSEKETKALAEFIQEHDFAGTLAFHSYGGEIQYAPDHTTDPTAREDVYKAVGEGMAARQNEAYKVERGGVVYIASGSFVDFADSRGILAYTIELAGGGGWGNTFTEFNPGEDEIEKVVENNLPAVLYFIEVADDPGQAVEKGGK